jgi:dTDP-4-amino-4,6-dideoxygalactose transaminase
MNKLIPFNWPYKTGNEIINISRSYENRMLAGDGPFTKKCQEWIETSTGCYRALLTHSCTAALEISALLINTQPGDEIIMPSYTFVSTANAFVLRGGVPVFIDISPDTMNMNPNLIEAAITHKTKAIVPVHYAGVSCDMDPIMQIAKKNNLFVIEDAAQGIMSSYKGRSLGSIGSLGAYSFHETKNIISGEGGSLLINDQSLVSNAEIYREKGTDRSMFFSGKVDKYTWQNLGSSYLPGELIASFLYAQLCEAKEITQKRLTIWNHYHELFRDLESSERLRRPSIPSYAVANGHIYYVILNEKFDRNEVIHKLKTLNIDAVFHYIPLHNSPAGVKFGRKSGELTHTELASKCILRLPMYVGLELEDQIRVIDALREIIR